MKTPLLSAWCSVVVLCIWLPHAAHALNDIAQYKLLGHWNEAAPQGYAAGGTVAVNDKWALVGTTGASDPAVAGGAKVIYHGTVTVYSTVTGAFVRKLLPPLPLTDHTFFGSALVLDGDLALIGAYGMNAQRGGAYLYNVATGKLVQTYNLADAAPSTYGGGCVAMAGGRVAIGIYQYNSLTGAVYIFDQASGLQLARLDRGAAAMTREYYGISVAAEGNLLVVGAENVGGKGAAFLYDFQTLQLLATYQPAALVAADNFGRSVALGGGKVFIGAPARNFDRGAVFAFRKYDGVNATEITASDKAQPDSFGVSLAADAGRLLVGAFGVQDYRGATYLYDVAGPSPTLAQVTVTQVRKIFANDAPPGDPVTFMSQNFGLAVALCGNNALVGADEDADQGPHMGAAYLLKPVVTPMSMLAKVVAKGESAPGALDGYFNTLGDAFINGQGESAFQSTLSGAGSHGGTDTGAWTTAKAGSSVQLIAKTGSVFPTGPLVQSVGAPLINESDHVLVPLTMKTGTGQAGAAVTTKTNKWIADQGGTGSPNVPLISGSEVNVPSFTTAKILGIGELVQSQSINGDRWAAGLTLSLTPGAMPVVTAADDTGVIASNNGIVEGQREGKDSVPGSADKYGQFTGRVGLLLDNSIFSAAATGATATNQVVVTRPLGGAAVLVARKDDPAPELAGAKFTGFLGETTNGYNTALYRAMIAARRQR